MNFKKHSFGFYASFVACILAIVACFRYVANASTTYYNDLNSTVIFVTVGGVVLLAGSLILTQFAKKNFALEKIVDLMRVVAPCFIIAACLIILSARVFSYGVVFFSDLEAGNASAISAATQSVYVIVLYAVTAVLAAITAFFSITKNDDTVSA